MPAMSAALSVRSIASLSRPRTDPLALRSATDREPGEQHDRHGMAGQALGQSFGAS